MQETTQHNLPLPRWCFVLLAVPTFYMLLAFLSLAVWVFTSILMGQVGGPPGWMLPALGFALNVTFVMWPIYFVWVCFSKRLTWREKVAWGFIVLYANMLGMPAFFIFMIRRYLGLEKRINKRDEGALDRLLKRNKINRDRLSSGQIDILRKHCRYHRWGKWAAVPVCVLAATVVYAGLVVFPNNLISGFADMSQTHLIIYSATGTRKEVLPDPELQKLQVQAIMQFGTGFGITAGMGLFGLFWPMMLLLGNWHNRALIKFLQAADEGP
ncbi:MAG: hypothetical protein COA78_18935 [Blastopirellula sp.]|nr:MAG: hypothetical protein COA78_18935 [Blastopirellula sp.]